MPMVKTADLLPPALDLAVSNAQRVAVAIHNDGISKGIFRLARDGQNYAGKFNPSADWSQGGPILDLEQISLLYTGDDEWEARWWVDGVMDFLDGYHPTPLLAAMRAVVAKNLGDTVEIPKELLNET